MMYQQGVVKMNLFVGNIPTNITDRELRAKFAPFGRIESAIILRDKLSNESRQCGFVAFSDRRAAQQAIEELNMKIAEKNLIV
ncbi:MAG: hypothetical protein EZS28_014720 [Streblomastix strix]|uniref:RRM domain-containing protein n=1 Tax=Streblomastix strix TaxID=222440 RepID=A0A5J4W4Y0_9EUKA|nr:MAG: hypothetical protein EZS28_014720 [Streblomastix strix]